MIINEHWCSPCKVSSESICVQKSPLYESHFCSWSMEVRNVPSQETNGVVHVCNMPDEMKHTAQLSRSRTIVRDSFSNVLRRHALAAWVASTDSSMPALNSIAITPVGWVCTAHDNIGVMNVNIGGSRPPGRVCTMSVAGLTCLGIHCVMIQSFITLTWTRIRTSTSLVHSRRRTWSLMPSRYLCCCMERLQTYVAM